jgi:hypothetical protein
MLHSGKKWLRRFAASPGSHEPQSGPVGFMAAGFLRAFAFFHTCLGGKNKIAGSD